jgi:glycosyltransferase involved in cell wall biosynthesis
MKIALVHDSVLPARQYGGIERIVLILARAYRARGHEVVIASRKGSNRAELEAAGFELVELEPGFGVRHLESVLPPTVDFIHSHQPLAERPSKPFLVTIHGNGQPGEVYHRNTNFLSQSHARNHSAEFHVFNGLEMDRYPFVEVKATDRYVFLAKTTWRVKNLKTAIAWAEDLGVGLDIMGGDGPSRGRIRYLGRIDDDAKLKILSEATALVYPTNWEEPCAAAPLEAMACGTPVITSANGCMPEMVDSKSGVVCRTYAEMLAAPNALLGLSSRAIRERAERLFSVDRMADAYLALMERIRSQGDLPHQPTPAFQPGAVTYLFKPTLWNRLVYRARGKI